VKTDSLRYYLKSPSGQQTYAINPMNWRVTRYARMNANGDVVEERLFGEFQTVDGVVLPTRVVFRNRSEEAFVMLAYEDLALNPEALTFDFRVPSDVPRVYLPSSAQ
jgi:hypothetical protein